LFHTFYSDNRDPFGAQKNQNYQKRKKNRVANHPFFAQNSHKIAIKDVPQDIVEYKRDCSGSQIAERPEVHCPDYFRHSYSQNKTIDPYQGFIVFFKKRKILIADQKRYQEISQHKNIYRNQKIEIQPIETGVGEKNRRSRGRHNHSPGRLVGVIFSQTVGSKKSQIIHQRRKKNENLPLKRKSDEIEKGHGRNSKKNRQNGKAPPPAYPSSSKKRKEEQKKRPNQNMLALKSDHFQNAEKNQAMQKWLKS
jgi:hypothetical protein